MKNIDFSEFDVDNKNYEAPKAEIYLMNVPFGMDYKDVVDFSGSTKAEKKAAQEEAFQKLATKHIENCNIVMKNGAIDVDGKLGWFEGYNYIMYRNPPVSTHWWYAFLIQPVYVTKNITRLIIKTDVWQSYLTNKNLLKSYIERAHIKKSADTIGAWTAAEGIGFPAERQNEIEVFSDLSFAPNLFLDANSYLDRGLGKRLYGGMGNTPTTMTGIYSVKIDTATRLTSEMSYYINPDSEQSTVTHTDDMIGLRYLPEWASGDISAGSLIDSNASVVKTDSVSIKHSSLASGYSPRNNKMYTSLARAFVLFNRNGTVIPLKPELLSSQSQIELQLSMRPMSNSYKVEVQGYKDFNTKYFNIPYSYSLQFGYNANTGVAQQTALEQFRLQSAVQNTSIVNSGIKTTMNAVTGVASGIMSSASSFAKQDVQGAISGAASAVTTAVNAGLDLNLLSKQAAETRYAQGVTQNNLMASIGASIGSISDNTNMTNTNCKLRLADCSPNYDQCKIMDNFLSAYGYEVDQIGDIDNWTNTRPIFNYVKTQGCKLSIPGCSADAEQLKAIFDQGTTIWHGLDNFGNYDFSGNNE